MKETFSLWIMPEGKIYEQLSSLIASLSKRYNAPLFEPHITLLGPVEEERETAISKTSLLASSLTSFEVKLENPSYLNEYFRCVFLKVENSLPLQEANKKAQEVFNHKQEFFFPHLSLLYGNYSESLKKKIVEEIDDKYSFSFKVNAIHLFSTPLGAPEKWGRVGRFSLSP